MSKIVHWTGAHGESMIDIRCGCCKHLFSAIIGGTAFCSPCRNGSHDDCAVPEIMGKVS